MDTIYRDDKSNTLSLFSSGNVEILLVLYFNPFAYHCSKKDLALLSAARASLQGKGGSDLSLGGVVVTCHQVRRRQQTNGGWLCGRK